MSNTNEPKEDQHVDWLKAFGEEFASEEGRAYLQMRIAIALEDICKELQAITNHLEGIRAGVGGMNLPWSDSE